MQIPGFIARQFYVSGSLRNGPGGFSLQAENPLSNGTVVGVGRIAVDGQPIDPAAISAVRDGDGARLSATDVSRTNPIVVEKGDRITLHVAGAPLEPGKHELEVELVERDLGSLRFSISETIAADEPAGDAPPVTG